MKKLLSIIPYLIISILIGVTISYAGDLTPPGPAEDTMYDLTDIYNLSAGTTATLGSGSIPSTPGTVEGTGKTLTEVYEAISAQIALLANAKIAKDVSAFNFTGTLYGDTDASQVLASATYPGTAVSTPTYGDNDPTKVLNTASNAGTYDTASCTTNYNTLNLSSATVKSGTTFGDSETGDYPSSTYPLSGDTGATDATASSILDGYEAWTKAGSLMTGTIPTQTLSAANETVSAGYYNSTTLSAVDADLAAGNILSGTTIFGVAGGASAGYTYGDNNAALVLGTATGAGTALKNLWNGTSPGGLFPGGSQADGGRDDYETFGQPAPSDRYAKGWTACGVGNSYCGTSDSGADAKDDSTGLVWSMPCNGSGCASFSDSSPLTYSWDSSAVNNNSRTASQLCSDHAGWFLPHQRQILQTYIDGSYGNLEEYRATSLNYWSATTSSALNTIAHVINLSSGAGSAVTKTGVRNVRCVR